MDNKEKSNFEIELEQLLNRHSMENGSDTPDFILAKYLIAALDGFNAAITEREKWYGRQKRYTNVDNNLIPDLNLKPSTTEPIVDLDSTGKSPDLKQSQTFNTEGIECDHDYSDGTGTGYYICKKCGHMI